MKNNIIIYGNAIKVIIYDGYSHVRSEASKDWLKLLSWLSGWLPEIGELLLVVAGLRDKFNGASESFELVALLPPLVYADGAGNTEPLVEWAGNLITSTRSTDSRYSFDSVYNQIGRFRVFWPEIHFTVWSDFIKGEK